MRFSLLLKCIVTGMLALALILPLGAIVGLVHDRQAASRGVLADIQQSGVGAQTLTGPILVLPFRRSTRTEVTDRETQERRSVTTVDEGQLYFLPDTLEVHARVGTERRSRGIYSALLYTAQHGMTGSLTVPAAFGIAESPDVVYSFSDAHVMLGIDDTRGIKGTPTLSWDGAALAWRGGAAGSALPAGVHAPVGRVEPGRTYTFAIELVLQGTQSVQYVPVGRQTTITMSSEWPHPSFDGQFLPESRRVTARGFDATWRTTHLASNVETALRACLLGGHERAGTLGVSFIEPVNVYLQTERAAKYGFLFVAITFVVFQLFELLARLAIHPVQYGLVGLGLALFFLLLLALSEHVSFALAYGVASASCVGLLGFYVSYVLRSIRRASGFTALLAALYGALYVLLRSEDMALLLGAALLFVILAAIMVITRHVDWYRIGMPAEGADGGGSLSAG